MTRINIVILGVTLQAAQMTHSMPLLVILVFSTLIGMIMDSVFEMKTGVQTTPTVIDRLIMELVVLDVKLVQDQNRTNVVLALLICFLYTLNILPLMGIELFVQDM